MATKQKIGQETEEQEFNVAEKRMLRVWALAEGHPDPGLGPAGAEAGSAESGRQVCNPGGSGAGNHTCHGGLWYHLSAQSQGQYSGSRSVASQPTYTNQLVHPWVFLMKWIRLLAPRKPVSYTHLTLPTTLVKCRSRWSPYH